MLIEIQSSKGKKIFCLENEFTISSADFTAENKPHTEMLKDTCKGIYGDGKMIGNCNKCQYNTSYLFECNKGFIFIENII